MQVYLGMDPLFGKKRYLSESVKGPKANAERRKTELLREIDTGSYSEPSRVTVAEYLKEWLGWKVNVTQRTLEGYQGNVERYIIPMIGNVPVEKLSTQQVQEMESQLLRKGGRNQQGLSKNTVLQVHRILSRAVKDGRKRKKLSRKVVDAVEAVDPPKAAPFEASAMAWEEVPQLLAQVNDLQYRVIFLLALQTGLRRSELSGLQWKGVDFENNTLAVQRARVKLPSGSVRMSEPKSGLAACPRNTVGEGQ